MKVLSIHQPNLFPWLGFFHKIAHSTDFYVFDHIQAPMGKSWLSRVKILSGGKQSWLTIPTLKSGQSCQPINFVQIVSDRNFIRKHLGIIKQSYYKSPFFDEVYPKVEKIYSDIGNKTLSEFNMSAINMFLSYLDIKINMKYTSDILKDNAYLESYKGNDLVLELAKFSGCEKYLSGTGCTDFIIPESFSENNLVFEFQIFNHPPYAQVATNNFEPGLSIIDAAMNLGWSGVADLLLGAKCSKSR